MYHVIFVLKMDLPRITCFLKMVHFTCCSQSNLVPKNIVTKNHSLKTSLKLSINTGYPKEKRKFLIHCYLKKTPFSMPVHNSEGVQVIQSILSSVATCSQVFVTSQSYSRKLVTKTRDCDISQGIITCWHWWTCDAGWSGLEGAIMGGPERIWSSLRGAQRPAFAQILAPIPPTALKHQPYLNTSHPS